VVRDEYKVWVNYYVTAFALRSDEDLRTVLSWWEVLHSEAPEDLYEATNLLLRSSYPSFLRDHLRELTAFLRLLRAERLPDGSWSDAEGDRGSCVLCGGSGRVIVPHPRAVRDGEWVPLHVARGGAHWYTCAVCCACALGRWYGQHGLVRRGREQKALMSLDAYERLNPNWYRHMSVRAQQVASIARLSPSRYSGRLTAEELDRVLRRLAEGIGLRVEE
jgi:hypothetical protein